MSGPPVIRGWRWVRAQAAGRISRIGERFGWASWTYNPLLFRIFDEYARHNAPRFADAVKRVFPEASSIADVGCGTGAYLAEFNRRGFTTRGWEYAARARRIAARRGVEVHPFDVGRSAVPAPPGRFDLVMTIEVAEHVPPPLADAFIQFVGTLADTVIFTAAQPGQGGQGHLNEQPPEYWQAKFEDIGFRPETGPRDEMARVLHAGGAFDWLSENLLVLTSA